MRRALRIRRGAAVVYSTISTGVIAFQVALAIGMPWGAFAMGGAFPGQFPPSLRVAALLQAVLSAVMPAIVLSRVGLALPAWYRASRWLTWVVVAVAGVSTVLNVITPSSAERAIWAPVSLALLASSLVVAFGGREQECSADAVRLP